MVSLSNNWSIKRNRKSGDWVLEYVENHGKRRNREGKRFHLSNRAAILLAETITREQEAPTSRKKLPKLERNRPTPKGSQAREEFAGCTGQEWLDRVRPDVIDFTHALILAKEASLRIRNSEGVSLSPYEAGVLEPTEVILG